MSAPTPDFVLGYRDLMLDGFAREVETTKRVLAAVPDGKKDHRPDPCARTAWELAWHLANTDVQFLDGIADLKFTMANPAAEDKPKTIAEVVDWYDRNIKRGADRVRALSAAQLLTPIEFVGVLQLTGGVLSGISEQSQHSSSGRVGHISSSHGIEGACDLRRPLRRALSGSGVK